MLPEAREEAVSSVVGTVLMLGITVAVFAGFSVVVLSYFQDQPAPPRSDLALVQGTSSLYLLHRGGESFSRDDGVLYLNNGGVEETLPMTDSRIVAAVGDDWDLGDMVCIQGGADGCLFQPDEAEILGAFFVEGGYLLLHTGERADPNAFRDLAVAQVSQSPSPAGVGDTISWTVRVDNLGTASVPAGAVVHVEVNGAQVATATVPARVSAGAFTTVTTTSWAPSVAGTFPFRLVVDPSGLVAESDEANNEDIDVITIAAGQADPGEPFIDLNGDGLYTPGVDGEMTEAQITELQTGDFDAGAGSLVLPPSVGPIEADSISFTAGGSVTIDVDLTASTNSLTIVAGGSVTIASELSATADPLSITAGGDIVFDSAQIETVRQNNDMTLEADGDVIGQGLVVDVNGALTITAGGTIDFTGATLAVQFASRDITLTAASIVLDGATLSSADAITVTSTAGPISAVGVRAYGIQDADADVEASGAQLWKATGGGIALDASTLVGSSLTACLASDTADGLSLSGALTITDSNNRLNAQRGSSCNQDANSDTYVTPWPSLATDSPRSKLE